MSNAEGWGWWAEFWGEDRERSENISNSGTVEPWTRSVQSQGFEWTRESWNQIMYEVLNE